MNDVKKKLDSTNTFYKGYKNSRGIIGAFASIAWSPLFDKTYELITYRKKER